MTIENTLEAIYISLQNDNENIDECILNLKIEMKKEDLKDIEINNMKLPIPNREGRNMLKSYFKKRGVKVTFKV
jgi:hypothetical protein